MSELLSNMDRGDGQVTSTATLHVEVIADFVCPFCFLGKRHLDDAFKAVAGPSATSWHPFLLNPEMPPEGLPFDVYIRHRFGSPAAIDPVLEHLTEEGATAGIQFRFDRLRHVPNTLVVHQLMQAAESLGADQSALADDLMSAFFEDGRNIGERGVLIDVAAAHGISARETRQAVGSDQLRQLVVSRESQVRASGLSGAPGFLINRRLMVVGAQSANNIVSAFDRAMFGEGTDSLISPTLH